MNKKLALLFIILISVCAISHASAADNSTDAVTQIENNEIIDSCNVESISADEAGDNSSNVYYVDSNSNVQSAIDKANEGDTIVLNGTFELKDAISINKTISIIGYGDGATLKPNDLNYKDLRFFNINSKASNVVLSNLILIDGNNGAAGAILWEGSNGSLTDCEFRNNMAKNSYGGAVVIKGNNCNITDCIFNKNQATQSNGGAISLIGENCLVKNCTFYDNYAAQNGGAIFVNGKKITISDCLFEANHVSASDNASMSNGGAIFSNCETLTIEGTDFNNNYASTYGGAVYLSDYNNVKKSSFKDNHALLGRDIYSNPTSHITSSNFTVLYNETESDAIYGFEPDNLFNNIVTKLKVNSSVIFSTSMSFQYGDSRSCMVTVEGGIIEEKNIRVLNHTEANITFKDNTLTVSNLDVGEYVLRVTTTPDENHTAVDKDLNITVVKATAVISASKVTVALKSSAVWTITLIDAGNKKPIANMQISLKVYTGNTYKIVNVTTNSKGVASFKTKDLSKGTHKVVLSAEHGSYNFNTLTSSITVVKQTALKFKLQSRVVDKGGSLLSYLVLNKKTGKGVNGIKVKVFIYTGKTYKKYTLKTKKIKGKKKTYNGAMGFSTNDFSAGKHKVIIKPVSIKYKGSVTTYIKIKKSATKGLKYFRKV